MHWEKLCIADSITLCLSVTNIKSKRSPIASLRFWKNHVYAASFSPSPMSKATRYICLFPSIADAMYIVPLYLPFNVVPSATKTCLMWDTNPLILGPNAKMSIQSN